MGQKYNLNAKKVFEKEFHIDFKGYSVEEVDTFLDLIIKDYQEYDKMIEELGMHLQNYEAENKRLRNEISALKMQTKSEELKNANVNCDNIDIIKRLTNLENAVFKK